MSVRMWRTMGAMAVVSGLVITGCGSSDGSSSTTTEGTGTTAGGAACAKDSLNLVTEGTLTIGTDTPAFPPWFVDDDPSNGKGFESAVAYAVADEMGFDAADVTWTVAPFTNVIAPGAKVRFAQPHGPSVPNVQPRGTGTSLAPAPVADLPPEALADSTPA